MIMSIIEVITSVLFSISFVISTKLIIQNQRMLKELQRKNKEINFSEYRSKKLIDQLENQSRLLDELTSEMLKKLKDAYHDA